MFNTGFTWDTLTLREVGEWGTHPKAGFGIGDCVLHSVVFGARFWRSQNDLLQIYTRLDGGSRGRCMIPMYESKNGKLAEMTCRISLTRLVVFERLEGEVSGFCYAPSGE